MSQIQFQYVYIIYSLIVMKMDYVINENLRISKIRFSEINTMKIPTL